MASKVQRKPGSRQNSHDEASQPLLSPSNPNSNSTFPNSNPSGSHSERNSVSQPGNHTGPTTNGGVGHASLLSTVVNVPGGPTKGKDLPPRAPKRTTKTSQKLTLFPLDVPAATDTPDDDLDVEPSTIPVLPHVTAKTQKERWLNRLEKKWLPRVTAYCTANSYNIDALMDFLKSRSGRNRTAPKKFDEAIHTPYLVHPVAGPPAHNLITDPVPDLINLSSEDMLNGVLPDDNLDSFFEQNIDAKGRSLPSNLPYDDLAKRIAPIGECLFFAYGVVVMWGLSEEEEQVILKELVPFEEEKLSPDDIEIEEFVFHYNAFYQPRIYNDIITLKNPANYMIKLTISHAIAQSVKLALFEGLIEETIESTKHVPQILAETGKIHMSRKSVNKKIGQLFIMRINVNLVSNVLDNPEIFWSEPALEPLYMAIRGYLEISQRVDLLNQRVSVISDLLDMLKEHQTSSHGEQLEWIVIILIAFEIIIGIVTISFDLSSYLNHQELLAIAMKQ
ncbi:hypothetical protein DFS34DRAFT_577083 [Phlyctochytrium arcticum]|nr:hypothetical protein DFS34DRAFT_577083 [Phlyctochytrium arcticum]